MKLFSKDRTIEDKEVDDLISEQRSKERIDVWRRGWCIQQATILDDSNEQNVVRVAEKIHKYVYGDAPDD